MRLSINALFFLVLISVSCARVTPPEVFGPAPNDNQWRWQQMEMYAFIHFTVNTFTDKEWGYGGEDPSIFNPTQLDCRQWVKILKDAGFTGVIFTAKHHDGFCLWPSAYTEHSVKNSPWKGGKGDVVRELADACREYGLKLGIYLSPWDRNHAEYAAPAYVDYFQNQLRELLTNYGPMFEVWFDGANGGNGWYGGANETRKIGPDYYRSAERDSIVRALQPEAVIFSDREIRWVGNEKGYAGTTNWATFDPEIFYKSDGGTNLSLRETGMEGADRWLPAEADVSIRKGWFYHPDQEPKSVSELMTLYYNTVGRNAALLLNFTPDTRGLIPAADSANILAYAQTLQEEFARDLVPAGKLSASNVRGGSKIYGPQKTADGLIDTYWATDDEVTSAVLTVEFDRPSAVNRVWLQEYIPLGQRVKKFSVEALVDGVWQSVADETTIGYKRLLRFPTVTASAFRLNIRESLACPVISAWRLFEAPEITE